MKTKKWIGSVFLTVMIGFMIPGLTTYAYADCPDKVSCSSDTPYYSNTWGTFNVPTCYKFGKGCKPWHCDGQYKNTNRDYWTDKCRNNFSSCKESNGCEASFPGALVQ